MNTPPLRISSGHDGISGLRQTFAKAYNCTLAAEYLQPHPKPAASEV
jgi:hypothetical protein